MTEPIPDSYLFQLVESGLYSPWSAIIAVTVGFSLAYIAWRRKKNRESIESTMKPAELAMNKVNKLLKMIFWVLVIIVLILLF